LKQTKAALRLKVKREKGSEVKVKLPIRQSVVHSKNTLNSNILFVDAGIEVFDSVRKVLNKEIRQQNNRP
jgi:hypothetical protein